jgi:hypothetical protein
MGYNRINLLLSAVLLIVLYFIVPENNAWLYDKILSNDLIYELQNQKVETRKEYRYGYSYLVYRDVKNKIPNPSTSVILFPPQEYLTEKKITNFQVPEPSVFYYFTGIKSVWINSPDADKANYAMDARSDGKMVFVTIKNKEACDTAISFFKSHFKKP